MCVCVCVCVILSTGRDTEKVKAIEAYLRAVGMYRHFSDETEDPVFSQVVELDLSKVVPSVSGPKRPQDKVNVSDMKEDFRMCLENKVRGEGRGRVGGRGKREGGRRRGEGGWEEEGRERVGGGGEREGGRRRGEGGWEGRGRVGGGGEGSAGINGRPTAIFRSFC